MKTVFCVVFLCMSLALSAAAEEPSAPAEGFTLRTAVDYALQNSPRLKSAASDVAIETYGIAAAKAQLRPRADFRSELVQYDYPMPLIFSPSAFSGGFSAFYSTIFDMGLYFTIPVYSGGRLQRQVTVAELKKLHAGENLISVRRTLVYDIMQAYYELCRREAFLKAQQARVAQLDAHRKDVESFLKAGAAPYLDLLKVQVELASARDAELETRNSRDDVADEIGLLMGYDGPSRKIGFVCENVACETQPVCVGDFERALCRRADYRAAARRREIAAQRIKIAQGKYLPDVIITGGYMGKSGKFTELREDWNAGISLSIPIFDAGRINSEIKQAREEYNKTVEDEKAVRLAVIREINTAGRGVENARSRRDMVEQVIGSAREALRVERVKYTAGAGTTTDVIDAQTALLRAETDYIRAVYDMKIAGLRFREAMGEEPSE